MGKPYVLLPLPHQKKKKMQGLTPLYLHHLIQCKKNNKSRNLISTNCVFVYATPIFPLVEDLGLLSGLFLLTTNRFIWLRRDIAQKGGHLGDWLVFRFHNVSVG